MSRSKKRYQLDPKSAATLVGLGQISAEMKDFVSARKYYEEALKLEPNGQYAQTAKEALQKLTEEIVGHEESTFALLCRSLAFSPAELRSRERLAVEVRSKTHRK